jgi:hypothetical protein
MEATFALPQLVLVVLSNVPKNNALIRPTYTLLYIGSMIRASYCGLLENGFV